MKSAKLLYTPDISYFKECVHNTVMIMILQVITMMTCEIILTWYFPASSESGNGSQTNEEEEETETSNTCSVIFKKKIRNISSKSYQTFCPRYTLYFST
jgi:hypothetical protein